MAETVIRYVRGNTYVKNLFTPKPDGTSASPDAPAAGMCQTAHGLIGELWVGGNCYDTIERMDNHVCLPGGADYRRSTIYWNKHYGSYVINPEISGAKYRNILFHPAAKPSHLEGCIAPGFMSGGILTYSQASLSCIWELCGGAPGDKSGDFRELTLRVEGDMQPLRACKPWSG